MTVTIKDVAARAGVSPKTVSRVMNGEVHVRQALRDAVTEAVRDLGYRPNAFARSLSSARSYLLAMFFDDPASGYATAMQRGAMACCRSHQYHLLVEPLDLATDGWTSDLDDLLAALRPDGAILTPPLSQHPALLARFAVLGVPHVLVSPAPAAERLTGVVAIDERHAAHAMTARLIALGHRAIGFVEGDGGHVSSALRRQGFLAAMAAAGLPVPDGMIVGGDFSFRAGLEAGDGMLRAERPPTAIFASNDDMALGVSVAATRLGVSVPGVLAIAGFDDAPTSRIAWPPITTVRQPVAEMGAAAVEMLVDPAFRDDPALDRFDQTLDFTIIERESTAGRPRPQDRN